MRTCATTVGETRSGAPVERWLLENGTLGVELLTLGGIITALRAPDAQGVQEDVVLGFDDLDGYLDGHPYFGALIGRVANRLGNARFTLDGREHQVVANEGLNALHGGPHGFDTAVWTARDASTPEGPAVDLRYRSPAGESGYPGTLETLVNYALRGGTLRLEYRASTDSATPVNLTNHLYFNLAGAASGSILRHELALEADAYTPVDDALLPTGEILPVRGTPFDFSHPHPIGERLAELGAIGGYDHNFVLRGSGSLALAARAVDPASGRVLEVATTEPGLQFYSGGQLDGSIRGKRGAVYQRYQGFCLEAQHFPDAPHHRSFPSVILRPGETYTQTTEYRFSAG